MENLTTATIENIRRAVQTELLKRGFTARLSVNEMNRRGNTYLEVTSEPFNTVPVIMESIKIDGTLYIQRDENNTDRQRVAGRIGVAYTHFGGGQNGTELFGWSCTVIDGREDIYAVQTR